MANISDKIIPFAHFWSIVRLASRSILKNAVLIKQKDTTAFHINVYFCNNVINCGGHILMRKIFRFKPCCGNLPLLLVYLKCYTQASKFILQVRSSYRKKVWLDWWTTDGLSFTYTGFLPVQDCQLQFSCTSLNHGWFFF